MKRKADHVRRRVDRKPSPAHADPAAGARAASPPRADNTPARARALARQLGDERARAVTANPPSAGQPPLVITAPGDAAEREPERAAEAVTRGAPPAVHRDEAGDGPGVAPPIVHEVLASSGRPLEAGTRERMEDGLGADLGGVRVHTDPQAAESARAVNAHAYTVGNDVVFAQGRYAPGSRGGDRLLAHELAHVVQQGGAPSAVQRTLGDGHDLTSPRFSRLLDLEAAYDGEAVIRQNASGRGVQAVQQALYDLGFGLPGHGADGQFGAETRAAVRAYQSANPPLAADGVVGKHTMAALDARFGAPALPAATARAAPWTPACVLSVLCPWSPHTIEVLRTRVTLKSFDSITYADEEWNGASWVPAPFDAGGYNLGNEIGVLNSSCEEMSETLYHEVLHAEQPAAHTTTRARESYAYRIGEEFSIAMGLGGMPSLRSTDAQGRQFADPAKVGTFVAANYPSVPASGAQDEIIGKAATPGHVVVQRPNGSTYERPAAVGEKVPGPEMTANETTHPTAGWVC